MNTQNELYELETSFIRRFPVVISLGFKYNNIVLHSIVIERSQRNQGLGTQILNELCAFADTHGVTITLTPDSSLGGNLRKLKAFYKKFGFKKYTECFFFESMIREPK